MGVINLDHYQVGGFAEEDLELLTAFGNAAAVALRNANALGGWPRKGGGGKE
jgi:GAF domain-containing protein